MFRVAPSGAILQGITAQAVTLNIVVKNLNYRVIS